MSAPHLSVRLSVSKPLNLALLMGYMVDVKHPRALLTENHIMQIKGEALKITVFYPFKKIKDKIISCFYSIIEKSEQ